MAERMVVVSPQAMQQADRLPRVVHGRVVRIVERLAKWPNVSGAKPLRHGLAGRYRIRTGDYRVQFRVVRDTITVEKIGHRDGFYEE